MSWTIVLHDGLVDVRKQAVLHKNKLGDRHTKMTNDTSDAADLKRTVLAGERKAIELIENVLLAVSRETRGYEEKIDIRMQASGSKRIDEMTLELRVKP